MRFRFCVIFFAVCCFAPFIGGQTTDPSPSEYQEVLVPLAPPNTFGANGSRWTYEFVILNAGVSPLVGYDHRIPDDVPPPDFVPAWNSCLFPVCPGPINIIGPGAVYPHSLGLRDRDGQFGLLLFLRKTSAPAFRSQLRIKDVSRNAESAGVELPVVPFTEFTSETIHLLNVPMDSRFRLTLRVYAPRREPATKVRIKMLDQATQEVLSEQQLLLAQPPNPLPDFYPGFATHADFLQLGNFSILPQRYSGVRFEVTSASPGMPIWAFVSVTNNESQEFTIVTPSRAKTPQPN